VVIIWKREYFYGRTPTWVPLTDERWRPVRVPSIDDATQFIAQLQAQEYHLRRGEYLAPDYGIVTASGEIVPLGR